jgi:hypothetical protein
LLPVRYMQADKALHMPLHSLLSLFVERADGEGIKTFKTPSLNQNKL